MKQEGIWALEAQDLQRIDQLLQSLIKEARARCGVMVDRTGQLLTTAGDIDGMDGTTFASLAAADFAASDQLALLLGESEFSSLYHQGEDRSMYLADVGGQVILAILFDGGTTLGLVRLKSKTVVPEMATVFAELAARGPSAQAHVEEGWLGAAEDEIDRLFADL